jgi:hypothetical protein
MTAGPPFTTVTGLPVPLTYKAVGNVSDLTKIRVSLQDSGPTGTTARGSLQRNTSLTSQDFPVAVAPPIAFNGSTLEASTFDVIEVAGPELASLFPTGTTIRTMLPAAGASMPFPTVPLLPGTYTFKTGPASFQFTVNPTTTQVGTVGYISTFESNPPTSTGFLNGQGSPTLTVLGQRISLDARLLQQRGVTTFDIPGIKSGYDATVEETDQLKRFIPGQYTLQATLPASAGSVSTTFTLGTQCTNNPFITGQSCCGVLTYP